MVTQGGAAISGFNTELRCMSVWHVRLVSMWIFFQKHVSSGLTEVSFPHRPQLSKLATVINMSMYWRDELLTWRCTIWSPYLV